MPQDKRLIITKAVVHKVQRVSEEKKTPAENVAIELAFIIPGIILQRDTSITSRLIAVSHGVYPKNGRSTVLIVPKVIAHDCSKINKRHAYFDAVVAAEAICRRGDEDSEKRALQVARTFSHFVVDARIVTKLPKCIPDACAATASSSTSNPKTITPLTDLEERESLAPRMATIGKGGLIRSTAHGQCYFRVGHGGMTAGDICENAKNAIHAIKQDYPTAFKFIEEFQLTSRVTTSIRFMEVAIRK
jgi:ribosomal protein L1